MPKEAAFVFSNQQKLTLGTEAQNKITISNSSKTLAFVGSGMQLNPNQKENILFAPRVIIPSLEGDLKHLDKTFTQNLIAPHLKTIAKTVKKELIAMHNNLMAAINKKEIGDNQAKG